MPPKKRVDLYAECNVEPRAPLDVFTAECCVRCVNPECTRSGFGASKFEGRISTWYERLFSEVPRMAPDDERFGRISGQKFLLIDAAKPNMASAWIDPRDLEASNRVVVPAPARAPEPPVPTEPVASTEPPPAPVPEPPPPVPAAAVADEPKAPTAPASPGLAFANTPVKQGQMLGNRPKPTASEWVTPPPVESLPDATVVKTGAKIRIGA